MGIEMKTSHFFATIVIAALFCAPQFTAAAEFMFRAQVEGQMLEGKPLAWNSEKMLLLGRDGWLHDFNPKLAKDAVKTSPTFVPYSAAEMKTMLQQEFDN